MSQGDSITTGAILSHYRILERLGKGGMGEVWKAENLRLKKTVAIKTLSPQLLVDEEAKLRFLREARLAARLDHPNIATVFDVEESDDVVFIVMEFIEGESLDKRIKNGGLDRREAIKIITEVGEALAEAHKHRIIHRDIKPHNIMITKAGRVKVLDFGLAKLLPTGQLADMPETATIEATALTGPGVTFGTRKYMSPEQWLSPDVDERSDIFSFGVVMFEMLVGELPFEGYQLSGIISAQSAVLSGVFQSVPKEFQPIITKALAKDRNSRYQSMAELIRDVQTLTGPAVGAIDEARTVPLGVKTEAIGEVATLPLVVEPEVKPAAKLLPTLIQALVLLIPPLGLMRVAGANQGKLVAAGYVALAFVAPFLVFWLERWLGGRVRPLSRFVQSTDSRVVGFSFITLLVVMAAALNIQDLSGVLTGLGDWRYATNAPMPHPDIVLIAIDGESRQRFLPSDSGASELRNWRKYHGQLIRNIVKYGPPKAIGFDVYFEDATDHDDDFAAAIREAQAGNVPVIIGEYFVERDRVFRPTTPKINQAVGQAIGHPIVLRGMDEIVRGVPLVLREKQADESSLSISPDRPALSLLMLSRGKFDQTSVIPGHEIKLAEENRTIPVERGLPYVQYLPVERFEYETFLINFIAFEKEKFQQLSYYDVYEGSKLTPNTFSGKYVVIGSAYENFEPTQQIPNNQKVYGYEIHASAINTILQNAYIKRVSGFPVLIVVGLVSIMAFALTLRFGSRLKVAAALVSGLCLALLGLSYLLFAGLSLWLDSSYAVFGAISVATFVRLTDGRRQ